MFIQELDTKPENLYQQSENQTRHTPSQKAGIHREQLLHALLLPKSDHSKKANRPCEFSLVQTWGDGNQCRDGPADFTAIPYRIKKRPERAELTGRNRKKPRYSKQSKEFTQ